MNEYTLDIVDFIDIAAFCELMQLSEDNTDTEFVATIRKGKIEVVLPDGSVKDVRSLLNNTVVECIEEIVEELKKYPQA